MKQRSDRQDFPYPRRRLLRGLLRFLAGIAFFLLGRVDIRGRDNLPESGPYILAANHFHFSDPVALLYLCDRQVEFVGGFRFPNAPAIVKFLPKLWGYFPVHRGAYSRASLDYAVATLNKGGVIGIFPEGGAWAQSLRYPRGGIGFIALDAGVTIVPVALSGFSDLFKVWRPCLTISIGKPIGPFSGYVAPELNSSDPAAGNIKRKDAAAVIGTRTMMAIAELLPENARGVFSSDPAIRSAGEEVAAYPFDQKHMRGM